MCIRDSLRDKLEKNTIFFREEMTNAGFNIKPGIHPIIPIMINDAVLAQRMAELLLNKGIYVVGFFYPVVPKGQARIRVQISAEMEMDQLAKAISIFTQVGQKLKIDILGKMHEATILEESPYDAENKLLRA